MNSAQLIEYKFAYIDESGDTGLKFQKGSKDYFVLVAVIIHNEAEQQKIAQVIQQFKKDYQIPDDREIKFNNLGELRIPCLERFMQASFQIRAMIINKTLLSSSATTLDDHIKKFIAKYLSDIRTRPVIDGRETGHRKRIASYFKAAKQSNKKSMMKSPKFVDSRKEPCIQLADMVAGSLMRSTSHKADRDVYKKIIDSRIEVLIDNE